MYPTCYIFEDLEKSQDVRIEDHPDAAREIIDACDPADFAQFEIEPITNLATLGPAFLVKILGEQNFLSRLNLILDNAYGLAFSYNFTWPQTFEYDLFERALPLLYPVEKFNVGDDRDAFKEILKSLPQHKQPNLAWCQEWVDAEGDYAELFLDMFHSEKCIGYCRWGYAFWDDDKILAWGARTI